MAKELAEPEVPKSRVDLDFRGTGQSQDRFTRAYKAAYGRRVSSGMGRALALHETDAEFDLIEEAVA